MEARKLLEQSLVVDGLFHSLLKDPPPGEKNIVDLLIDGGVTAINATVVLDYYKNTFDGFLQELYQFFILEESLPDQVIIAKSVQDIRRAKAENKLALILSMQGADALEHDLRYITMLHRLGVRIVQITYNQRNNLGCGSFEPHDAGLGRFGQQAIYEMNRLGLLVDLSHVGYRTSMDAIEVSTKPCVFSHSSVKNLREHPRNIRDDQIKAVAAKGGVVGLCPHSVMCMKENGRRPTVDDFIDHIVYIMDLADENAVGIGTDRWMRPTMAYRMLRTEFERTLPGFFGSFDGTQKHVDGFNFYDEWENLIESMLKRSFTEAQIVKVLGGNFLRVLEQAWGD